jgi:long-chain fatty acid transport protein
MKLHTRKIIALAILGAGIPGLACATNGMYMIGYGAKSQAMGGVGIAYAEDSLASVLNPANLVDTGGIRADIGADLFLPNASATLGVGDQQLSMESRANTFVIPNMGFGMKFSKDLWLGMTMVGVGGGGSRYNQNLYDNLLPAGPDSTLGVNLMIAHMNPTVAYRINRDHSIGASLIIGIQTFRAFGLGNFSTFVNRPEFSDKLTNNGNDWAYGAGTRLGWKGDFFDDKVKVGASYTSKVYMSRFKKYEGLFAEQGSFDNPGSYGVGIAFLPNDTWTFEFDVVRILYEDVKSVSNIGPNSGEGDLFPVSKEVNGLGEDEGLGFGWKDQTVYKLGMGYQYSDKLKLRAGWNYGESPIDETREIAFNIVAPATVQHHATLGGTYQLSPIMEVSFSYVHAFTYEQYGPTYIGTEGRFKMNQNAFGLSLGIQM